EIINKEFEFKKLKESDSLKNIKYILKGKVHEDNKGEDFAVIEDGVLDKCLIRMSQYIDKSKNEVDEKFGTKVVIDKDKINSSLPTTISSKVNFMGTDSKGKLIPGVLVPKEVKFGVKTVVHV